MLKLGCLSRLLACLLPSLCETAVYPSPSVWFSLWTMRFTLLICRDIVQLPSDCFKRINMAFSSVFSSPQLSKRRKCFRSIEERLSPVSFWCCIVSLAGSATSLRVCCVFVLRWESEALLEQQLKTFHIKRSVGDWLSRLPALFPPLLWGLYHWAAGWRPPPPQPPPPPPL